MQRRLMVGGSTALAALSLAGCAAPSVDDYAAQRPVLDLRNYFNGIVDGYGIFTDRSGKVVKRFTVRILGSWNADEGVLDEDFLYSDGSRQKRVWRLQRHTDGSFTGRADDVVGVATGRQRGNALHWQYTMALPVDGRVFNVSLDDWMVLIDERVMLNKARMSKFGIRLGEVTLSFTKRD